MSARNPDQKVYVYAVFSSLRNITFSLWLTWEGKKPVLKRRVLAPKVPQNSAEPLGFCRKVLQNVSHSKKLVTSC